MEKIVTIEETTFTKGKNEYGSYDGYLIATTEQIIKVGISSGQCCCERFGYLTTNDDISEFIGADILGISITDTMLNNKPVPEEIESLDSGDTLFVNIETSVGIFQIVAYNSHNGYYGHEAVLISKQLNASENL